MVKNRTWIFTANFVCEECGLEDFRKYSQAEEHEIECRKNPLIKSLVNSPLGTESPVELTCPYQKCSHTKMWEIGASMCDSFRYELPLETNKYMKTFKSKKFGKKSEGILIECPKCSLGFSVDVNLKTRTETVLVVEAAKRQEKFLELDGAAKKYKELGMDDDLIRVRKLKAEQGAVKVAQKVVHGDYVDDRDTIIKDSVISKSNIGAGGKSKAEEIKEIKELLDSGAIDDAEFKQMKKEILEK